MTGATERSMIDEERATEAGAQGLAAADLAGQVMRLIHQALHASKLDQKTLSEKLGVTQGRVSQVLNSDGNMRIAAVARYLRALGYETQLIARPVAPGLPQLPLEPQRSRDGESQFVTMQKRYVARLRKTSRSKATHV